jgi:CDP-2,3-bis-(O-geranylgeranyl)-sn-glycerol synthase
MHEYMAAARALLLLALANGAPWVAARLLGKRWAWPLDCGLMLRDGRRLLGSHKTWRGLLAGSALCAALAPALGLSWTVGASFAMLSLLADALTSAIKRRLSLVPGADVPGLDQLPEALLPLIVLAPALQLGAASIGAVALAFLALNLLFSGRRGRQV